MDGPSVFGAVLDRGAGSFRLGPADVRVPSGRRYLPGTMIVETTWATPTGWAVVRDALLVSPRQQDARREPDDYRRGPRRDPAAPGLPRAAPLPGGGGGPS